MQQVDPDLLERYFKGACSENEKRQVEDWLKKPQGFTSMPVPVPSEKQAQLKEELWEQIRLTKEKRTLSHRYFSIWSLIAACLLIILALLFKYQLPLNLGREQEETVTFHAPYGKKSVLTLPDGSLVELNAGALLSYPKRFESSTRKIALLQGEGFFTIAQDEKHPFIVQLPHAQVHVLGTRFNVSNRINAHQLAITLESGKIAFKSQGSEQLMQPGEQLNYDVKDNRVLSVFSVNLKKVTAWRNNVLLFEETPLKEVFRTLGNYYGVQFVIRKKLDADLLFTAQFRKESLERVLELIELSTDLHCHKEQHRIIVN